MKLSIVVTLPSTVVVAFPLEANAATTRYEAESAPATCAGTITSNHSGFSGTGFCDTPGTVGAAVQFGVAASGAGTATPGRTSPTVDQRGFVRQAARCVRPAAELVRDPPDGRRPERPGVLVIAGRCCGAVSGCACAGGSRNRFSYETWCPARGMSRSWGSCVGGWLNTVRRVSALSAFGCA